MLESASVRGNRGKRESFVEILCKLDGELLKEWEFELILFVLNFSLAANCQSYVNKSIQLNSLFQMCDYCKLITRYFTLSSYFYAANISGDELYKN